MNTTKDRLFKDAVFIYALRCAVVRRDCAGECGWAADMDSQSLNKGKSQNSAKLRHWGTSVQ